MLLLTLLDQPFVCHENILRIHNDDFSVARAHRKVIEADVEQVEGKLKVVVGELLRDVHQLARQVYPLLPGCVVEAPQLLAHVVNSHHAPTCSQVLGKWPPFIRWKALRKRSRCGPKKMLKERDKRDQVVYCRVERNTCFEKQRLPHKSEELSHRLTCTKIVFNKNKMQNKSFIYLGN